ncbi:MAG: hypothetical protein HY833_00790 [Candidatus Aenigmarchaeota archaeon]|nr:hypothetical protein [Candidatus Aenigmarchaeota archaeon]
MVEKKSDKSDWFCPRCKKFVAEVRSEYGSEMFPQLAGADIGMPSIFVCRKCDSPVVELTKSVGKRKLITEKGIIEVD